jgi:hypothetical protein
VALEQFCKRSTARECRVALRIGFLDDRLFPHQNVRVRGRLVAIMIALAVLALAGIRNDDQAPTAQRHSAVASGQIGNQPAPEPDGPAIIPAAVNTSATIQTVLVVGSHHQLRPASSVFTVRLRLPVVAPSADKPRFFPLLI